MPNNGLRPRPHQVTALSDLTRALAVHRRTQLIMACGAGKTLVGRWHAQAANVHRIVVFVPSLALLAQTLTEWRRAGNWNFDALVVCSDPTTAAGRAERAPSADATDAVDTNIDTAVWESTHARVTTDPDVVAEFLRRRRVERVNGVPMRVGPVQVVFSTYHSAPVVAAGAHAADDVMFDLMICDEAHRLAGNPQPAFRAVLDDFSIASVRRVFMTATPLTFDTTRNTGPGTDDPDPYDALTAPSPGATRLSMDDETVFGPVAHTVSFADAIEAGLLCDYRLYVIGTTAANGTPGEDLDRRTGTVAAIDDAARRGVRRILSYHGRVAAARDFAAQLDGRATADGKRIAARVVHSGIKAGARSRILDWLADPDADEVRVVTNARCLTEGVDVPAIDAVLFADPRESVVDVMQAVGRVLRPAPGKSHGHVLVPIDVPESGLGDDTDLLGTSYATVWNVVRALRAHDERLADALDRRRRNESGPRTRRLHEMVEFVVPDHVDLEQLRLRMVTETTSAWEEFYAIALDYGYSTAGKLLTRGTVRGGRRVGEWAERQRVAYRRGHLTATKAARLEEIPGWAWSRTDALWQRNLSILATHVLVCGTVADADRGVSRYAGVYDAERRPMGRWLARQRLAYADGQLAADQVADLEALPGWTWNPHSDEDAAAVEALRIFAEFEKHLFVPDQHVEDDQPLGRWLWQVRRRRVTDTLPPELADTIAVIAPRNSKGAELIDWQVDETTWRLGFTALRRFLGREGHTRVPSGHVEDLGDTQVRLANWVAQQRHQHKKGTLDGTHVQVLEALQGWSWTGSSRRAADEDPIDLPDGVEHGTVTSVNLGCRCGPCGDDRARRARDWARNRRVAADAVDATATREHLDRLRAELAAGATARRWERAPGMDAVAAAANVPVGVARHVGTGRMPTLSARHARALQDVTAEQVFALFDTTGSRGRPAMSCMQKIDAGPTRRLLAELLELGWPEVWLADELGYSSRKVQIQGDTVSRLLAGNVAALHTRIGGRQAPARPNPRSRLAPLEELEARGAVPVLRAKAS